MRPVILGEAPGRTTNPDKPLSSQAGIFLMQYLSPVRCNTYADFALTYELRNVLPTYPGPRAKGAAFPSDQAQAALQVLSGELKDRYVVALGARIRKLMSRRFEFYEWYVHDGMYVACIPHPSGLTRQYNMGEHRAAARRVLQEALDAADASA